MYRLTTIYSAGDAYEEYTAEFESVDDMLKYSDHLYNRSKKEIKDFSKTLEKSLKDYIPGEEISKEDLN